MARRVKESHASLRLAQRTGIVSFRRLKQLVREGHFEHVERQTCTRSMCRAVVDEEEVFFVINRMRGTIITVLTREQALSRLKGNEDQRQAPRSTGDDPEEGRA